MKTLLAITLSILLSACGGGGDEEPSPEHETGTQPVNCAASGVCT